VDYSLFSSSGNLIESFTDEAQSREALQALVAAEPEAADDVALFIADDEGALSRDRSTRRPSPLTDRRRPPPVHSGLRAARP
jgi:hypothetical protein